MSEVQDDGMVASGMPAAVLVRGLAKVQSPAEKLEIELGALVEIERSLAAMD